MLNSKLLRRRSRLAIGFNMATAVILLYYLLAPSNPKSNSLEPWSSAFLDSRPKKLEKWEFVISRDSNFTKNPNLLRKRGKQNGRQDSFAIPPQRSWDSRVVATPELKNRGLEEWVHPRCKCVRHVTEDKSNNGLTSTCPPADFRGPHQKVLSYSFYGNVKSKYFKGVAINAETIATHYPGWTMRLYHNTDPSNIPVMSSLCREVCRFPHLDECYVGDITNQFGNITKKYGTLWRFLVLGDPSVDTFAVRDLDSPIYQREVDAVNDWLATNKTWHIMRDHPFHSATILGGMWGARNVNRNISQMRNIVSSIVRRAKGSSKHIDQQLLDKIVWPIAKKDMVAHDSFYCQKYPGTKPWPSPRVNDTVVGQTNNFVMYFQCPVECRPKDHPEWNYC